MKRNSINNFNLSFTREELIDLVNAMKRANGLSEEYIKEFMQGDDEPEAIREYDRLNRTNEVMDKITYQLKLQNLLTRDTRN